MRENHTVSVTQDSTNEALTLVCNLPVDSQAGRRVDMFAVLTSAMNVRALTNGGEFVSPLENLYLRLAGEAGIPILDATTKAASDPT